MLILTGLLQLTLEPYSQVCILLHCLEALKLKLHL